MDLVVARAMLCLVQAMPLPPQLIFRPLTARPASASTVRQRVIKVAGQFPVRATLMVTAMMI